MSLEAAAIYQKPGLVRDVRNSKIRDVRKKGRCNLLKPGQI
jgi:hypothetical protein